MALRNDFEGLRPKYSTMVSELLVEQPRLKTQVGKGLPQRLAHQF